MNAQSDAILRATSPGYPDLARCGNVAVAGGGTVLLDLLDACIRGEVAPTETAATLTVPAQEKAQV